MGCFGGPFIRCWAKGPGAGERPRENGPWAVFRLGPHEQFQNSIFLLFQKHFEYEFE